MLPEEPRECQKDRFDLFSLIPEVQTVGLTDLSENQKSLPLEFDFFFLKRLYIGNYRAQRFFRFLRSDRRRIVQEPSLEKN